METLGNNDHNYPKKLLEARSTAFFITIPQTTIDYKELHSQLINYSQLKFVISKLEEHKDQGKHIHLLIKSKTNIKIKQIHKIIMSFNDRTETNGLIDYQQPKDINASINYLKKEDTAIEPPLIWGDEPRKRGRQCENMDESILESLELAKEGNQEEALELIKQTNTRDYLLYKNQIMETLQQEQKPVKKWDIPTYNTEDIKLTDNQQLLWDKLQQPPKARQIFWITGQYGSGKTFIKNYIENNYEYGTYDAGQSASLDNVAYAYNGEGAIMWDLPRTFDFTTLGDTIANVIEKFSDFGTKISSKKYNGKTQHVRGHTIVFSNTQPIQQLQHRDIIHIDLSSEAKTAQSALSKEERSDDSEVMVEDKDDLEEYIQYRKSLEQEIETKYPLLFRQTNKHIDLTQPTESESETEEEEEIKVEPTEYPEINKAYKGTLIRYLVHYQNKQGGKQLTKAVDTIQEAQQYFNNNNYYQLDYK